MLKVLRNVVVFYFLGLSLSFILLHFTFGLGSNLDEQVQLHTKPGGKFYTEDELGNGSATYSQEEIEEFLAEVPTSSEIYRTHALPKARPWLWIPWFLLALVSVKPGNWMFSPLLLAGPVTVFYLQDLLPIVDVIIFALAIFFGVFFRYIYSVMNRKRIVG